MSSPCGCCNHVTSTQQTLSEMDFERGIWSAALNNEMKRLVALLDRGTDVNIADSSGYTALHYACRYGHYDVTRYLLDHGACVNARTRSGHVTPIQRASSSGHSDVVRLLLERGANPGLVDTDGRNALHKAAENGRDDVIRQLLTVDTSLKNVTDKRLRHPTYYLPSTCDKDLVRMLTPDHVTDADHVTYSGQDSVT